MIFDNLPIALYSRTFSVNSVGTTSIHIILILKVSIHVIHMLLFDIDIDIESPVDRSYGWPPWYRHFNKYRISNFHPMTSNYFQVSFWILFKNVYSLNKPETINEIENNSKGKLKIIWRHLVKITYSVRIKRSISIYILTIGLRTHRKYLTIRRDQVVYVYVILRPRGKCDLFTKGVARGE